MKSILAAILALILASLACGKYVTPAPTVSPPVLDALLTAPPQATKEAIVTAIASASITPKVFRVTASRSLHVRAEPLGIVIGYLYAADTVTLTDKCSDGWAQIEWRDGTAWVKAKYLSENSCQAK